MSKQQGKRALAPSQPTPTVGSFAAAWAACDAAHEAYWRHLDSGDLNDPAPVRLLKAAAEVVVGTPASTPADIARKVQAAMIFGGADAHDLADPAERARIVQGQDDEAKAQLAIYMDLIALATDDTPAPASREEEVDEVAYLAEAFDRITPWPPGQLVPTNEQWSRQNFYLQLAASTVRKDGAGLVALVSDLGLDGNWGPDGDTPLAELLKGLNQMERRAALMVEVGQAAHARLLAAAAKAMQDAEVAK